MKMRGLLIVAVLALLAIGAGMFAQRRAFAARPAQPAAVDFSLTSTDGKTVKLSDYRGKVVLVNFWATWCHYCVGEIPDLKQMQADSDKSHGKLQIIGVSVDTDKGAVKNFVSRNQLNYPIVYSDPRQLKAFGQIYGYPTSFIVDDRGVIVDKIVGALPRADYMKRLQPYLK